MFAKMNINLLFTRGPQKCQSISGERGNSTEAGELFLKGKLVG